MSEGGQAEEFLSPAENPWTRRLLGVPGRRTRAAKAPFAVAALWLAGLLALWLAAWLAAGSWRAFWLMEAVSLSAGSAAAAALLGAPVAGIWARRRLEREPILPELLLSRMEPADFLAGQRALAGWWTRSLGAVAGAVWFGLLLAFIWRWLLPNVPRAYWSTAVVFMFALSLAGALNLAGGFYMRASLMAAALPPVRGIVSLWLLAALSCCARLMMLAIAADVLGLAAAAFAVFVELALLVFRLGVAEAAWAGAEPGFRERLLALQPGEGSR